MLGRLEGVMLARDLTGMKHIERMREGKPTIPRMHYLACTRNQTAVMQGVMKSQDTRSKTAHMLRQQLPRTQNNAYWLINDAKRPLEELELFKLCMHKLSACQEFSKPVLNLIGSALNRNKYSHGSHTTWTSSRPASRLPAATAHRCAQSHRVAQVRPRRERKLSKRRHCSQNERAPCNRKVSASCQLMSSGVATSSGLPKLEMRINERAIQLRFRDHQQEQLLQLPR